MAGIAERAGQALEALGHRRVRGGERRVMVSDRPSYGHLAPDPLDELIQALQELGLVWSRIAQRPSPDIRWRRSAVSHLAPQRAAARRTP